MKIISKAKQMLDKLTFGFKNKHHTETLFGKQLGGIGKAYFSLRSHPFLLLLLVFFSYLLLAAIANWSLLTGDNLMRWDIISAHYPNSVFLEDSLKSGILPLWNPSMQFGSPHYAIVGTPIFYPTTIISALIGYRPMLAGAEYVFHIAVGCFGMFFLARDHLGDSKYVNFKGIILSFISGAFYGFSTVFLSNAEHIMIVISAAWIPFILYFTKIFIKTRNVAALLTSGLFAGLVFIGGYPEMFAMLFIVLIPYFAYMNYKKEYSFIRNIIYAAGKYILMVLCTIAAGAILLIPTIQSTGLLDRASAELGQSISLYPLFLLFSSFIPKFFNMVNGFSSGLDLSMLSMYIGILTLITIPLIIIYKNKNKVFYIGMIALSFLFFLGRMSFLHSLFYKFIPLFDTFRFPMVWRVMIAIFTLLLSCFILKDLFYRNNNKIRLLLVKILRVLTILLFLTSFILWILGYISKDTVHVSQCHELSSMLMIPGFIMVAYLCVLYFYEKKQIKHKPAIIILCIVTLVEILSFQFLESPITIGKYEPTQSLNNEAAHIDVFEAKRQYWERNKSVEYKNAQRSEMGKGNSVLIAMNKTLDEHGYVSYVFSKTENYKKTYNRVIIAQNPEAYFTRDIVSSETVNYSDWVNSIDVRPSQIYIENSKLKDTTFENSHENLKVIKEESQLFSEDGWLNFENKLESCFNSIHFRKILVYTNSQSNTANAMITFKTEKWETSPHKGTFTIKHDASGSYFEVYFPDNQEYTQVKVITEQPDVLKSARFVIAERTNKADYVTIETLVPNTMRFTVDAPADGYLTVLQNNYPGWNLYVDGKKTDITEVDRVFMGVYLEKGTHTVEFKFVPIDFFIGLGITAVYICVWAAVVIIMIIRSRKRRIPVNERKIQCA